MLKLQEVLLSSLSMIQPILELKIEGLLLSRESRSIGGQFQKYSEGEFGVIVVVKSACPNLCNDARQEVSGNASSVVPYRIDGQNAKYLGDSDMHYPKLR
eukprot:scaffold580_cov72-Cylindrotheca_fusiformis.AAC.8